MVKKHLIPLLLGISAGAIFFLIGGPIVRMLPIGDTFKGLLIVIGAFASLVGVNNYFTIRFRGKDKGEQQD